MECVQGPFLVVGAASALDNWIRDVALWCPALKTQLYDGDQEERAAMRSLWKYNPLKDPPPNLVITSFGNALQDIRFFSGVPFIWKYLTVDEQFAELDEGQNASMSNGHAVLRTIPAASRSLLTYATRTNNWTKLCRLAAYVLPQPFDSGSCLGDLPITLSEEQLVSCASTKEHVMSITAKISSCIDVFVRQALPSRWHDVEECID